MMRAQSLTHLEEERKEKHHIWTGLGVMLESSPRRPRRAVGKWPHGALYDHSRPPRHYLFSGQGIVTEVMDT